MCFVWVCPFDGANEVSGCWEWDRKRGWARNIGRQWFGSSGSASLLCRCLRFHPEVCKEKNKERLCLWLEECKAIRVSLRLGMFTVALAFSLSHNEAIICVSACMCVDFSAPPADKDAGGRASQLTARPTSSVAHSRLVLTQRSHEYVDKLEWTQRDSFVCLNDDAASPSLVCCNLKQLAWKGCNGGCRQACSTTASCS